MATGTSLAGSLRDALVTLLSPLELAATPEGAEQLLRSIGRVGAVGSDSGLQAELLRIAGLIRGIQNLSDDDVAGWDGIAQLLSLAQQLMDAIRGAEQALSDPTLAAQAGALGEDLAERLLTAYLRGAHGHLFRTLCVLGLITPFDRAGAQPLVTAGDGTVTQLSWNRDVVHAEQLSQLINQPAAALSASYLPDGMEAAADAHAGAAALFPALIDLASAVGLRISPDLELVGTPPPDQQSSDDDTDPDDTPDAGDALDPWPAPDDVDPAPDLGSPDFSDFDATYRPRLSVELLPASTDPAVAPQFGVSLIASSAAHPDHVRGYLLELFGGVGWTQTSGGWTIGLTADGAVPAVSIGPGGLLLGPGQVPGSSFTATLSIQHIAASGQPAVLVGGSDSSHLSIGSVKLGAGLTLSTSRTALEASLDASSAMLVISGGGDGFLAALLPSQGLQVPFSLGAVLSTDQGLQLRGGPGLSVAVPARLQAGPVALNGMTVALSAGGDGVHLDARSALAIVVGPITATVQGLGLRLTVAPTPNGGNLGPVGLDAGITLPTGLGVAVSADVVSGGGFINRDPATGRYDGALELRIGRVDITALGLLETRLPAGEGSYALLVALSATFPGIEIGFGFALTGVGGLLALNRAVDVDALRARLASGSAGRILAPQDPIANAPSLLADLDTVFPVTPGITVVGPTAQLTWADLVQFNIGVFIELPGPTRVVLLGSASAQIAEDGRTYLSINVDVVGVVDLQGQTAAFDAVLVNSHLMGTLDLTGGAALRLSWGSQPYAVLSIGGFNPSYNPAPLTFPSTLTPVAMVHGAPGDEVYLRFEGYFAITTNTLQFGASVEAQIHSGGWSIHGTIAFDALLQRVPFHFEFDINASVSVSYDGHNLASLTLSGSLSGPGPIVLKVRVSIELLFFEVSFSDTFELGPTTPPPAPTAPDLLSVLSTELTDPACLRAAGGPDPLVTVTAADPALTVPLVAPTGALVWDQQRAPLQLLCDRVGGTPLPAPAQVTATTTGASTQASDWFAPGQFINLSDDQALTQPGYELLSSGLRLGDGPDQDGPSAQVTPTVQQIRIPEPPTVATTVPFPGWLLTGVLASPAPAVTVTPESWTLSAPTGQRTGLAGAQARQLAALTPGACAIVSTDTLPAMTF